jgi:nucleoid DNA-binding protein
MNMNKSQLIEEVAQVVDTKKEAEEAINRIFESITNALKKRGTVSLAGFGTFKVSKRKPRTGRNPRTGEEIRIPAKNTPKFAPAKALKEAVDS